MSAVSLPDMNRRRTRDGVTAGLGTALDFGIYVWPQHSRREAGVSSNRPNMLEGDLLPLADALSRDPKLLRQLRCAAVGLVNVEDNWIM